MEIVGSGAFAIEQVRTTLEQGAGEVVVLSRQRGTVCPLIVDYLNFVRPYDKYFAHNKNGSTAIFQAWKDAFKKLNVTEPECWKRRKNDSSRTYNIRFGHMVIGALLWNLINKSR